MIEERYKFPIIIIGWLDKVCREPTLYSYESHKS